jgi:hypothetical protein
VIAALGAAIFATLEPKATLPNGNGTASTNGKLSAAPAVSNWRRTARAEALRER